MTNNASDLPHVSPAEGITPPPDLQACEHCSKEFPIETMQMMEDCWFCEKCTADWQAVFDACEHQWEPHVNTMGDAGQYCTRCMGFVCNEDMRLIVKS